MIGSKCTVGALQESVEGSILVERRFSRGLGSCGAEDTMGGWGLFSVGRWSCSRGASCVAEHTLGGW